MTGHRHKFTCPNCQKTFTYWLVDGNGYPKPKCYYCGKDFYPNGEPPKEVVAVPPAAPAGPAGEPAP